MTKLEIMENVSHINISILDNIVQCINVSHINISILDNIVLL